MKGDIDFNFPANSPIFLKSFFTVTLVVVFAGLAFSGGNEAQREISILLLIDDDYGANYNLSDGSDNIREQFEAKGWHMTLAAVTDSVVPCVYAASVGCPVLATDCPIADITDIAQYDALVILPGESHDDILNSPEALSLIKSAVDSGVVVAAWCRAVRILARADVIDGLNVVGHADYRDEYKAAGAEYLGNNHPPVVQGNIITSVRSRYYRTAMCDSIAAVIDRLRKERD